MRRGRLRSVCHFFLPRCNAGFKLLWVCLCVRSYRFADRSGMATYMIVVTFCCHVCRHMPRDAAKRIVMAAGMLHGLLFWGGSRSTKPCVFPCKVAAGGDERYLLRAAGAAAVDFAFFFAALKRWLQAALGVLARA